MKQRFKVVISDSGMNVCRMLGVDCKNSDFDGFCKVDSCEESGNKNE